MQDAHLLQGHPFKTLRCGDWNTMGRPERDSIAKSHELWPPVPLTTGA